jgi:hypothetical protein
MWPLYTIKPRTSQLRTEPVKNQAIAANQVTANQAIKTKNSKRKNVYTARCTYSKNVSTSSPQQERISPDKKKTPKRLMKQGKEF